MGQSFQGTTSKVQNKNKSGKWVELSYNQWANSALKYRILPIFMRLVKASTFQGRCRIIAGTETLTVVNGVLTGIWIRSHIPNMEKVCKNMRFSEIPKNLNKDAPVFIWTGIDHCAPFRRNDEVEIKLNSCVPEYTVGPVLLPKLLPTAPLSAYRWKVPWFLHEKHAASSLTITCFIAFYHRQHFSTNKSGFSLVFDSRMITWYI